MTHQKHGIYHATPGETLTGIAGKVYGNPQAWHAIAQANSLPHNHIMAHTKLVIPVKSHGAHPSQNVHLINSNVPVIFEMLYDTMDSGDKYVGRLERITGHYAFRHYNWIKNAPSLNRAGNLRGMVVSKNWAGAFHIAETTGKYLNHAAIISGIVVNCYHAGHELKAIANSSDDGYTKTAKISSQVSAIILRTLLSGIPDSVHMLHQGVVKYGSLSPQSSMGKKMAYADAMVNTSFETVMDGDRLYSFINAHLVIH